MVIDASPLVVLSVRVPLTDRSSGEVFPIPLAALRSAFTAVSLTLVSGATSLMVSSLFSVTSPLLATTLTSRSALPFPVWAMLIFAPIPLVSTSSTLIEPPALLERKIDAGDSVSVVFAFSVAAVTFSGVPKVPIPLTAVRSTVPPLTVPLPVIFPLEVTFASPPTVTSAATVVFPPEMMSPSAFALTNTRGLSTAEFISVTRVLRQNSRVSRTAPWTWGTQRRE